MDARITAALDAIRAQTNPRPPLHELELLRAHIEAMLNEEIAIRRPVFRPLTLGDLYRYQGAEEFEGGWEPLIAYTHTVHDGKKLDVDILITGDCALAYVYPHGENDYIHVYEADQDDAMALTLPFTLDQVATWMER